MADLAVFASGNGSNFEALARALNSGKHRICCLLCDRKDAYVLERARRLSIPAYCIPEWGRDRQQAESKALALLGNHNPDLVVLAGFMRVLSPLFLQVWREKVVNLHPSLLPKYPGTRGIEESYLSGDEEIGITIHLVNEGVDTGPVLLQKSIRRDPGDTLEETEQRIHELEHTWYPIAILDLLAGRNLPEAVD